MLLSLLLCWYNCFIFGPVINYEVSVVTGDVRAAGTNAKVFMQIYGETGKTELIILENRSNNFERGATDIFKVWLRWSVLLLWQERNDQPNLRHQQNNWSKDRKTKIDPKIENNWPKQNLQVSWYLLSSILFFWEVLFFFWDVLCLTGWLTSSDVLVANVRWKNMVQ